MIKSTLNRMALALAAVVVLAAAPVAMADRGPGKDGNNAPAVKKIEGRIVAVTLSANSVTIQTRAGAAAVVAVNAQTKVERNDRRAPLSAFKLGDRAQAEVLSNGIAVKLESVGP